MRSTPAHEHHNPDLLTYMPRQAGCIVEVGCSVGALAREYKRLNPQCRYVGIELDPELAALARRHCDAVHAWDVETLEPERIRRELPADCWVFGDVLEHLRDPWAVLAAVRAALPPHGCVVACIPNAQHWSVQLRLNSGDLRYEDSGLLDRTHLRWFTRKTIFELFQGAGLRIEAGHPRIAPHPAREQVLAGVRSMAAATGADPQEAVADALATQYVVRAVPEVDAAAPRRLGTEAQGPDIESLKRAVERDPRDPDGVLALATALLGDGRPADAVRLLDAARGVVPPSPELLRAHAWALLAVRRNAEALECFDHVLALHPGDVNASAGAARSLVRLQRAAEALARIDAVLTVQPDCAEALATRALLLLLAGQSGQAGELASRAERLDPAQVLPGVVRGLKALHAGQAAEALVDFERVLTREARNPAALVGRAQALEALQRPAEALQAVQVAARADPENPAVYLLAGRLMIQSQRFAEAAECFGQVLQRDAHHVEALAGRAQCLGALLRVEEALAAYDAWLAAAPDAPYAQGERFYLQLRGCDWTDYEARRQALADRVRRGERADFPASFLVHSESPADQLHCARTYAADRIAAIAPLPGRPPRSAGDRVRVAYVSADFHAHPTAFLAAGLFEQHDRTRVEVFGISYGRDDGSPMRRRLERSFDRFIQVSQASDLDLAQRIAALDVDIAVDLKGHTLGGRPALFAYRPAPVQVSFLAYPGTMGVNFLDYLIADRHVVPETHRAHYSERLIYMPDTYQVNDAARQRLPCPARREAGLPQQGIVFVCFNALYKITPDVFDAWMHILRAVPGSVLWLLEGEPSAMRRLNAACAARGVDAQRLIFAPAEAPERHWARCALGDLFLDTYPTNAHTTASDALWAAVPVVTWRGETFTSRVATSLLHAIGLESLSVANRDEYVQLALRLARDPERLQALRTRLEAARARAPLFDTARYCRHLEDAWLEIAARARRGEPPTDLVVVARP